MHGEMHGLSCPCGMHCIWDMILTCNGVLHCICTENIAYHGCGCMVEKSTLRLVIDWVGSVLLDEVQQSHTVA